MIPFYIKVYDFSRFMVFNTTGIALSYQFGALLPWRPAVLVEAGITAVTGLAVFVFCPESHVWLLLKQREEAARYLNSTLQKIIIAPDVNT